MSDLMLDCLKNAGKDTWINLVIYKMIFVLDEYICFELELRSKSVSLDRPLATFTLCSEPVKRKYLLTMCSQPITPHVYITQIIHPQSKSLFPD